MFVSPRDVLNRLRWKEGESLSDATIYYVSRGRPGDSARTRDTARIHDAAAVSGAEIRRIEPFGFELSSGSYIPYHRVFRIEYRGEVIFDKLRYQHALRH